MTSNEKCIWLIKKLISENDQYCDLEIPENAHEQRQLLRALMNVRRAIPISEEFLKIQNEYLQEIVREKGVTDISELNSLENGIYLWQGDITTLRCDAIVNAANSGMTGCYAPCHGCIDNCIHTYAGVQLRLECDKIMRKQGYAEPTGKAKITGAYNLPCKYVLHTVGPIIRGKVREKDIQLLASCYTSCLKLADENRLNSIAFCCISTGEFHFPNQLAAEIAGQTVRDYKRATNSKIEVAFNVFKDVDYEIYRKLLGQH